MGKTTTLNLRVDPEVKLEAEAVLKRLGIPMATAIDMYLRQIALTGGIPFSVTLPENTAGNFRSQHDRFDFAKAESPEPEESADNCKKL